MAPSPRHRRLRSLGKALLFGVILCGGLLFFVQTEAFSRQIASLLSGAASQLLGERVVVGAVRVHPWARRVDVEGVAITHKSPVPAQDGEPIAAVARASVVLGWEGLRPTLRLVEVVRPTVKLHVDADGLREFRALTRAEPKKDGSSFEFGDQFPWQRLRVLDASLSVEGQGWKAELSGLDLAPERGGQTYVLECSRLAIETGTVAQASHRLRWRGIVLRPDEVQIPQIELILRPEQGSGLGLAPPYPQLTGDDLAPDLLAPPALQLSGDLRVGPEAALDGDLRLEARLEGWNSALPRGLSLVGGVDADVELRGALAAPLISGALALADLEIHEQVIAHPEVVYRPGDLSVVWRLDGPVVVIEPLVDRWAGGTVELRGTLDTRTMGVSASLSGENLSFSEIMTSLSVSAQPWVDYTADLEAQVAGTLSPLAVAGSFEVDILHFALAPGWVGHPGVQTLLAVPKIQVEGELRLRPDEIELLAHRIHAGNTTGSASATIGFSGDGPLELHADLNPIDLSLLRPLNDTGLFGVGRVTGRVWGPFSDIRIEAEADVRDFQVLDVPYADHLVASIVDDDITHLELTRFQAEKGRSRYAGSLMLAFEEEFRMDLQVLLQDAYVADIMGLFLEVPNLDGHLEGTLSLEGDPYAFNGEADLAFRDVNLFGEAFPTGFARANMDNGRFVLDDLVLERDDGAESLLARGSVGAGWATNLEVVTGGLRLERLDLLPDDLSLRGNADLDLRIGGTLFEPEPKGRLSVRDTWLLGKVVQDTTLRFHTANGRLDFEGNAAGPGLSLWGSLDLWEKRDWHVRGDLAGFPISVIYPVAADNGPVDARITGRVDVSGALADGPSPVDIDAVLDEVAVAWGGHALTAPAPWRYTQHGKQFLAESIALVGGGTSVSFGASRGPTGTLLFGGGGKVELDLARALVPSLTQARGIATVELVMKGFDGRPPEPEFVVQIQPQAVGAEPPVEAMLAGTWFPEPFEDLRATITAAADGYEISDTTGRLGGGAFSASGRMDAKDWVPVRFDLEGSLRDARIQYFDYLPPVVGDAHLSFDGPADAPLLGGDILVKNMVFADRIDWEDWVLELAATRLTGEAEEASANYFSMDLHILADDTVRVRNNLGDLSGSADLRVLGDTARPGMVGTVRMDAGGSVYFKDREFELMRGEIRFVDPYAYDPDLDISLRTDVKSREQEFTIDYRVSGPYSDWRTDASSDPPLPQSDINALLLFGMTQDELERYGGLPTALALEGGDLLAAKFGLVQRVGEGLFTSGLFRLDRVDLVSGVSERGRGQISSEIRLLAEKNLGWDTTFVIDQNLSRTSDTYLGLEKRLARTLYARAYWASQQYDRTLNIGGAYGLDVNLRWEFD